MVRQENPGLHFSGNAQDRKIILINKLNQMDIQYKQKLLITSDSKEVP